MRLRHVARPFALLLVPALLLACAPAKPVAFSKPELALSLTYPGEWSEVDRATLMVGLGVVKAKTDISTEGATEAMDHMVLAIAGKTRGKDQKDAPNLAVLVFDANPEVCAATRDPRMREADALAVRQRMPGARQILSRHVTVPGIDGQSFEFQVLDRKLLQHHYWYCTKGKVVLIEATSSTPEGEAEVKKVLETVVVGRH